MMFLTSLLVILSLISSTYPQQIPTTASINAAKQAIGNLISNERDGANRPLIAGFVRLAFHDCVGAGGCDGCIDHNNGENAGLKRYTDHLDGLYDGSFSGQMSRADFYVVASGTALEMATENTADRFTGFNQIPFGRSDCSTSPAEDDPNEVFPDANLNFEGCTSYFANHFGFNPRETIALLGAHTLGRANTENSGYEGPWVRGRTGQSDLNNVYYSEIVNRPWDQVEVAASGKIQWQIPPPPPGQIIPNSAANRGGNQPNMLFNSDAALFVNLNLDENDRDACFMCPQNNARAPPGRQCCAQHTHSSITSEFAADNSAWINEFTAVYVKMVSKNDALGGGETGTGGGETGTGGGETGTGGGETGTGGGETGTGTGGGETEPTTTTTTAARGGRGGSGRGGGGGGRGGGGGGRGGRGRGRDTKEKVELMDELFDSIAEVEEDIKLLKDMNN